MNDTIKVMSIGCLTVILCVAILVAPENTQLIWTLVLFLGSVLGIPALATGVKTIQDKRRHIP